jgi:hypothetical protein
VLRKGEVTLSSAAARGRGEVAVVSSPEAAAGFGSPESHAPQARVDGDTTEDACETAAEENAEAEAEAEAKSESETGAEAAAEAEAKPGQSAELSS